MIKSWKTSLFGAGGILTALIAAGALMFDGNPSTNPEWGTLIPLLFSSLVGIFARDKNVTSEQQGLK